MPPRDAYHQAVVNALIKDGWTITSDPYIISFGPRDVFVDIGAERLIAASRGTEKIAVEVKTFRGTSETRDFENALGQFLYYHSLIRRSEPDRRLYLAVSVDIYEIVFTEPGPKAAIEDWHVEVVSVDIDREEISQWLTKPDISRS